MFLICMSWGYLSCLAGLESDRLEWDDHGWKLSDAALLLLERIMNGNIRRFFFGVDINHRSGEFALCWYIMPNEHFCWKVFEPVG